MRRAALQLGITQPALSRSVAQIEERFGQPLLERHSRGVVTTPFGERVLSSVLRLSRQWELAEQELRAAPASTKGTLRIEAGPLWRAVVLPRLIGPLQKAFPDLSIELTNLGSGTGIERLNEGRIDALFGGLQFATDLPPRLTSRPFTAFHDRVLARETHPVFEHRDGRGEVAAKRLLDYPWLIYSGDPIYEIETLHATAEALGRAPDVRIRCESLMSVISVLQHSDCLCILPDAAALDAQKPRLAVVPVTLGRRRARSGAIYREEMAHWPPLMTLLSLCDAYFGGVADIVTA